MVIVEEELPFDAETTFDDFLEEEEEEEEREADEALFAATLDFACAIFVDEEAEPEAEPIPEPEPEVSCEGGILNSYFEDSYGRRHAGHLELPCSRSLCQHHTQI